MTIASCLAAAVSAGPWGATVAHEDKQVDEIVVQGRWDRPLGLSVSASQGFVSQAEIDLRPSLRPGDLLEIVPGLIVTQHSGTGKSNQMFLRGFNLDHGTDFATWIDGMPINMPTHGHGQGYTDLNFIITELVNSIEFRKGPYYTDVSDFSSAGAAFLSTPRELESAIFKAGIGEDGYGRVLYADSFDTERGDWLLGAQAHIYDGPWIDVAEDLRRYNVIARYSEVTDAREWSLMFMGYDAQWNSADQIPKRAVDLGLIPRLGSIDDTVGGATSRYSLSGRFHRNFGAQDITLRAYLIDYSLDLFSNFTYLLEDPVNGDQFQQVDDRDVYGGDLIWRSFVDDETTQTAGIVVRFDNIGQVGLYNSTARERLGTVREDRVAQISTGIYYDYERVWNDAWRMSLGARADFFNFDVRESNLPENTGSTSDALVSPKLNVIRTLSNRMEAYLSAGFAFHSNDARGTVIKTDPASGDPVDAVDPLVRSRGAELGFRFFDEQSLNISAAIWYLELDSELLFVGDAGNTEPSLASRRYGLELPVYWRLNDNWLVDMEVALTQSDFVGAGSAGDEIPGSLDRVFAAGLVGTWDNGVYGTLRVRHFGVRPLTEDGSVRSDSSTVWNLGLGFNAGALDLRLELLNLFDSDDDDITYYYESRLRGEPAEGISDIHFHPIEPRTIRAYVTWSPRADNGKR